MKVITELIGSERLCTGGPRLMYTSGLPTPGFAAFTSHDTRHRSREQCCSRTGGAFAQPTNCTSPVARYCESLGFCRPSSFQEWRPTHRCDPQVRRQEPADDY